MTQAATFDSAATARIEKRADQLLDHWKRGFCPPRDEKTGEPTCPPLADRDEERAAVDKYREAAGLAPVDWDAR